MADFDFGNLFYIAIMIAFAIFGAKKKKKPQRSPYSPADESRIETKPGFFEKIIGDQMEKYMPEQEETFKEPVFEHVYEDNSYEENRITPVEKIEKRKISKKKIKKVKGQDINYKLNVEDNSDILNIMEEFDLRKAVIYSEILSRKEY